MMTKLQRSIDDYATDWETNARADPCFAVLSDPDRRDGQWDVESFMRTGRREVAAVLAELAFQHIDVRNRRCALDFGCGVGRLTAALAAHFDEAVGVDVAPTMIERAREAVHAPNVAFVLNQHPDLRCFDDGRFDFVYSNIVLQHVSNALQRDYLAELCRVLAPDGLAVIQVPSVRRGWRGAVQRRVPEAAITAVRRRRRSPESLRRDAEDLRMEMNCLPEATVIGILDRAGAEVECVFHTNAAEPDFNGELAFLGRQEAFDRAAGGGYISSVYVARRRLP